MFEIQVNGDSTSPAVVYGAANGLNTGRAFLNLRANDIVSIVNLSKDTTIILGVSQSGEGQVSSPTPTINAAVTIQLIAPLTM